MLDFINGLIENFLERENGPKGNGEENDDNRDDDISVMEGAGERMEGHYRYHTMAASFLATEPLRFLSLFVVGAFIAGSGEGSEQKGALTSADFDACSETDEGIAPYYKGTIIGPAAGSLTKVSYVDRCQDGSVISHPHRQEYMKERSGVLHLKQISNIYML